MGLFSLNNELKEYKIKMVYSFSDRSEQYLREVKLPLNILSHVVIKVSTYRLRHNRKL